MTISVIMAQQKYKDTRDRHIVLVHEIHGDQVYCSHAGPGIHTREMFYEDLTDMQRNFVPYTDTPY